MKNTNTKIEKVTFKTNDEAVNFTNEKVKALKKYGTAQLQKMAKIESDDRMTLIMAVIGMKYEIVVEKAKKEKAPKGEIKKGTGGGRKSQAIVGNITFIYNKEEDRYESDEVEGDKPAFIIQRHFYGKPGRKYKGWEVLTIDDEGNEYINRVADWGTGARLIDALDILDQITAEYIAECEGANKAE